MTAEVSKFEIVEYQQPPLFRCKGCTFYSVLEYGADGRHKESWGPYPSEIEAEHAIVRLQRMICR
jgi:hypothetical protein